MQNVPTGSHEHGSPQLSRRSVIAGIAGVGGVLTSNPIVPRIVESRQRQLGQTFFVRGFGAIPDDGVDDTVAIRAAFDAAASVPGSTVVFEPGVYYVRGTVPNWRSEGPVSYYAPIFDLNGHVDLLVQGNGAILQAENWATIFRVSEVAGITFSSLTIDWERDLPHTDGIAIADTPEYVDVQALPGFTVRPGVFVKSLIGYDAVNRRYVPPVAHNRGAREPQPSEVIGPDVLRCYKHPDFAGQVFPVGEGIVVKHTDAVGTAFVFTTSSSVVLDNVTIHASPGPGVFANDVNGMSLVNSAIAPPEGRWMSTSRGATNWQHCTGQVVIADTDFIGTGDDAFNFHGFYYRGVVQPDGTSVLISERSQGNQYGYFDDISYRYAPFYIGDTIRFSIPDDSLVGKGNGALTNVTKSTSGGINRYLLSFADTLPAAVLAAGEAAVFNISRMPDQARFESNRVRGITGGGVIAAWGTTISGNEFASTWNMPLRMEPGWGYSATRAAWLGLNPKNVEITGNTFDDCTGYFRRGAGLGVVAFLNKWFPSSPSNTLENYSILNNTFVKSTFPGGQPVSGVLLNSASDITISGNSFPGFGSTEQVLLGTNNECATITIDGVPAC